MAYTTQQIYSIVNGVNKQMSGSTPIDVINTNSFVSLGAKILSSQDITTNFTNTLVQRIARTVISFRMYNSRLKPLVFDDIKWGGIVQKLKVEMPEAVEDESYDLVDGKSVDMYTVKKPKIHQKFFISRTPYMFYVTIQRWQLQRAFLSEANFGSFISAIFGEIQNKLEVSFERLGYLCMNNFMGNLTEKQTVPLVTRYNSESGAATPIPVGMSALNNSDFLRFAISEMNLTSLYMEEMTKLYNAEGYERHTPRKLQRFVLLGKFEERLKTVVQWEAFHKEYVSKAASILIPNWQSPEDIASIQTTNQEGQEVKLTNVVGFIHDRDALGTYRKESEVLTTPVNAKGRYTNTFWHEEQMWVNDLSENGIIFTLN